MTYIGTPTTGTSASGNPSGIPIARAHDDDLAPPFRAVNLLSAEIDRLDQWISTFIGRLVPYSMSQDLPATDVERLALGAEASPLEQLISDQTNRLIDLRIALDNANTRLRL